MGYASKKLVVSFGTFSCELDGFDNPFPVMREAVDYFQTVHDADDAEFDADAFETAILSAAKAESDVQVERSEDGLRLFREAPVVDLPLETLDTDLEPAAEEETAAVAEADDDLDELNISAEGNADIAANLADFDLGETEAKVSDTDEADIEGMDHSVLDAEMMASISKSVPWPDADDADEPVTEAAPEAEAAPGEDLIAEAETASQEDDASDEVIAPEADAASQEAATSEKDAASPIKEEAPAEVAETEAAPAEPAPRSLLRARGLSRPAAPLFTADHLSSAPASPPVAETAKAAPASEKAAPAEDIQDTVSALLKESPEPEVVEQETPAAETQPLQAQPAKPEDIEPASATAEPAKETADEPQGASLEEEDAVIARLVERDEFITKQDANAPAEAEDARPEPLDLGMASKPAEPAEAEPEKEPEPESKSGGFGLSGLRKALRLGGGDEPEATEEKTPVKPEVVKPSAPSEAIDPLQLTKALRVEEEVAEEPAPAPVQPAASDARPQMRDLTAETSEERRQKLRIIRNEPETVDAGEEAEEEDFVDDGEMNLRNFAHRVGAASLPELLEASAAYRTIVEQQQSFSRPAVLNMVDEISGEKNYTAEARIKSFGKLLRTGKIIRVDNGQFAVSNAVRFSYESKMGS